MEFTNMESKDMEFSDDILLDFTTLQELYRSGAATPIQVIDLIYKRIEARGDDSVWIHLAPREEVMARARYLEVGATWKDPFEALPLFGIPFAVKDNIDVAEMPTTAACPAYAHIPAESALVVQKLINAGALCIGKTNLDQFATGLVGNRSPYGKIGNPFDADYIPGGSSSGSAVAVAAGMVSFALGTDTAGSGRVPAAFNNIVGLKPTRGLVGASGIVPACRSLDCVSVFALTTQDSREVLRIAQGFDALDPNARGRKDRVPARRSNRFRFKFGTPRASQLEFFGDRHAARLYGESIDRLIEAGGERVEIDFTPFRQAAELLYGGPFVAERLEATSEILNQNPEAIHPLVRGILESAKRFTALDLSQGQSQLNVLRKLADEQWLEMDVLLLPTTGTIYTHAQIEANPLELNTNLGYYTNFVNMLDLCALAVPAGFRPNGLPAGITFIAQALEEEFLFDLGALFQHLTALPPGTAKSLPQIVYNPFFGIHTTPLKENHHVPA